MSRDIRVRSCVESTTRGKAILLVHVPTHSQRFARSRTCQILYYSVFCLHSAAAERFRMACCSQSASHAPGICLSVPVICLIAYPYAVLRVGYDIRVHTVYYYYNTPTIHAVEMSSVCHQIDLYRILHASKNSSNFGNHVVCGLPPTMVADICIPTMKVI